MKRAAARGALWLAIALAAGLAWLLTTQAGLRTALWYVQLHLPVRLAASDIEGRLWGDLAIRNFTYEAGAAEIRIDRARLRWRPLALLRLALVAEDLDAGTIEIRLADVDADADPPGPLDLRLPLRIDLHAGRVQSLRILDRAGELLSEAGDVAFTRASWGRRIDIERMALMLPGVGPLQGGVAVQLEPDRFLFEDGWIAGPGGPPREVNGYFAGTPTLRIRGLLHTGTGASDLQIGWRELRWPPEGELLVRSPEGIVHLTGPPQDLAFKFDAKLGAETQATGEGRWAEKRVAAKVHWQGFRWPLEGADPAVRSVQGSLRVDGLPDAYRFDIAGDVTVAEFSGEVDAGGTGDRSGIVAERLRMEAFQGEAEGRGRLSWVEPMGYDVSLRFSGVNPETIAAGWPGALAGEGKASGPLDAPQVDFELSLRDSKLRGYPLTGDAQGRYDDGLTLASLTARSGATALQGKGRVTPPFDLEASVKSTDLASLWPGLGGELEARAKLSGALPRIAVKGEAHARALRYQDYAASALDATVDVHPTAPIAIDVVAKDLRAGTQIQELTLAVRGTAAKHRATLAARQPEAQADVALAGGYDFDAMRWQGEVAEARVDPQKLEPWTLEAPARLTLARDRGQLEPLCGRAGAGRACAQVSWLSPREAKSGFAGTPIGSNLRSAFRVEGFDLAYFQPLLENETEIAGTVDGTGLVAWQAGRIDEARADLATSAGTIVVAGQRVEFAPSTLRVEEAGAGMIAKGELNLARGKVLLDARLGPGAMFGTRPLSGRLDVTMPDLAWLALLSPEISDAQGSLAGGFDLGGTPREPRLDGELELGGRSCASCARGTCTSVCGGSLRLGTPGIELKPLVAALRARPGAPLQLQAKATSGEGQLQLAGTVASKLPLDATFTITGKDFLAINLPEAKVWVTPDLKLAVQGRDAVLGGTLTLPKADLTPRRFERGGIAPSADQVLVEGEQPVDSGALRVRGDVRVELGDAVNFDGLGLKTRLAGGLNLIDEPGRPTRARGELSLVGGRYRAYGQDLTIETGRLLFAGGPVTDPALDVRAVRRPSDEVLVGVRVRGPLAKPQFALFSEPAMTQEEQLAWLVLGRPLEQSVGSADNALLANAALSLGLAGGESLAQRLGARLGIDEISLGAEAGQTTDQARFTIGKYFTPRLYVSYGFGLFQPGHFFRLLFDIGRGFKLSAESGVHSGGDVLYTIER